MNKVQTLQRETLEYALKAVDFESQEKFLDAKIYYQKAYNTINVAISQELNKDSIVKTIF